MYCVQHTRSWKTDREATAVHQPQALHEDFVSLGNGEVEGKVLSVTGPALQAVEVEQHVVEDGELVRDGEPAVADLLV